MKIPPERGSTAEDVITSRSVPYRDLSEDIARTKELMVAGHSIEDVIREMRARGCIQNQVTEVLRRAAGLTHEESKRAVVFSEAWEDFRASTLKLHEVAEMAIADIAGEDKAEERLKRDAE